MLFRQIADERLAQYTYLIACQQTGEAIVIDPERDVDRYLEVAALHGLKIRAVAETHIHADFLSGSRELGHRLNVPVYLSDEGDAEWKYTWPDEGTLHIRLLKDGDAFTVGNVEFIALHTPGHTPEHLSFQVTDRGGGAEEAIGIATGDFVFVGDLGRPDLLESAAGMEKMMEPSARRLFASAREFLDLPDHWQVWPGHGAGSACGKSLGAIPQSTVGYEKRHNEALATVREGEDAFVKNILAGQTDPPLYFARMKRLNKEDPPRLEALPRPVRMSADRLDSLPEDAVLLDTRTDESAFMARHVQGAQLARFDKTFPTVVGSLVADPETRIILAIDEENLDEAVRCLVRMGFDRVEGFIPLREMETYLQTNGASIEEIDFRRANELRRSGEQIVDVRYRKEYEEGHMPDAVLAPYTRLPEYLDDIPSGLPLIVHCSAGIRSAVAAAFLRRKGWNVRFVNDDFASWAASHGEDLYEGVPG